MSTKSWFEHDYNGATREQEKRELGNGPRRHWMVAGKTVTGLFVDDVPFCFKEHQWKLDGSKFPLFATCLSQVNEDGTCVGCGAKGVQKAEFIGHLTMVDISGYTNKDGKEVRYELVEFCPKLKVMNKFKLKKQAKGTFVGWLCNITRADKEAPNTGDDFDFTREAKMDELYKIVTYRGKNISEMIAKANGSGEEAVKMRKYLSHNFDIPAEGEIPARIPVFNYAKLHAPLDVATYRELVSGAVGFTGGAGGSKSSGGSASSDDNVPF